MLIKITLDKPLIIVYTLNMTTISHTKLTSARINLFSNLVTAYHLAVYNIAYSPSYVLAAYVTDGCTCRSIEDSVNGVTYFLGHQSTRVGMHSWWKSLSGHEKAEILSYNPETN